MSKINYYEYVNQLVKNKILSEDLIYIFKQNGYFHEVYNDIFNFFLLVFGQRNIQQSTFIAYVNDFSVNAFAAKDPNFKLIGINAGVIEIMHDFFEGQKDIFLTDEFQPFEIATVNLNNHAAWYIMFRYFVLFIFFHELGHIFQKVDDTSLFEEYLRETSSSTESLRKHKKEYDADIFACLHLLIYIKGDFSKMKTENQSKENLLNFSAVAVASIMIFFQETAKQKGTIYFRENSHPHPLIRFTYILNTFVSNMGGLSEEFQFSVNELMTSATKVVCSIMHLNDKDIYNEIANNVDEIKSYVSSLEESKKESGYAFKNFFPDCN